MLRTYQPKKLQRKKEQSQGQSQAQLLIPVAPVSRVGTTDSIHKVFQGGAIRP